MVGAVSGHIGSVNRATSPSLRARVASIRWDIGTGKLSSSPMSGSVASDVTTK